MKQSTISGAEPRRILCQRRLRLRQAEFVQRFLQKFSWVNRGQSVRSHVASSLMIVDNFNIECIAVVKVAAHSIAHANAHLLDGFGLRED